MITVRIWGGMGNQMFQYAYARALKERTGQEVYIDHPGVFRNRLEKGRLRDYALGCFSVSLPRLIDPEKKYAFLKRSNSYERLKYELSSRRLIHPYYYEETNEGFNPDMYCIKEDAYLHGFFQNERYFSEYRDIILKEFTLVRDFEPDNDIKELLDTRETVSVHIRRGDYKSIDYTLPPAYQNNAIRKMSEMLKDPYFLFFSDDIGWVKENIELPAKYLMVSSGKYTDYEEMNIMSSSGHNIIANSTFSWWGAWLNKNPDKIVIAPRKWMRLKDPLSILPDSWTVL